MNKKPVKYWMLVASKNHIEEALKKKHSSDDYVPFELTEHREILLHTS